MFVYSSVISCCHRPTQCNIHVANTKSAIAAHLPIFADMTSQANANVLDEKVQAKRIDLARSRGCTDDISRCDDTEASPAPYEVACEAWSPEAAPPMKHWVRG